MVGLRLQHGAQVMLRDGGIAVACERSSWEVCDSGEDEDGDGLIDCADGDCQGCSNCPTCTDCPGRRPAAHTNHRKNQKSSVLPQICPARPGLAGQI